MRCRQPGCTGTIVDGYCDVCGLPPATSVQQVKVQVDRVVPAPARPSARGNPPAESCSRPGCPGRIVDGYCDVCGTPSAALATRTASASPAAVTGASIPLASTPLGSARASSAMRRRERLRRNRTRHTRIGAGIIRVDPAPEVNPFAAVMSDPVVPEKRRNCPSCGKPVGRSTEAGSGSASGTCENCGAKYSFTPKLKPGDVVAGQYEVVGALAHGGMGWIYLARDLNVSGRAVVLKGLLNSEDPDLAKATISEQQFLARVSHPSIVEIYNFVTADSSPYIVMEYVGGRSLMQLLKQRKEMNRGVTSPLPVDQAVAFLIEILPALSYLHDQDLLYCDFKPDNVIQVGDSLKLIDLGGVRHLDDQSSEIYGTVGYQAPEVATSGPSVASDIYTIGRTLLVLCADLPTYQTEYATSLPDATQLQLFADHESVFRLISKCCAPDPNDRFVTVEEVREQLLGILREEVGWQSQRSALMTASSAHFDAPTVASDAFDWTQLPQLRPDVDDPQLDWLMSIESLPPTKRLVALEESGRSGVAVSLARARTALELSNSSVLLESVKTILAEDPWEWRALWLSGLDALNSRSFEKAQSAFNAVYGQLPGELAPKLALAIACEFGGEADIAEELYQVCARTDSAYVPAAGFGLARLYSARKELPKAVAALAMVPSTSRGFSEAQRLTADHLLAFGKDETQLSDAMIAVTSARMDQMTRLRYELAIYEKALTLLAESGTGRITLNGVSYKKAEIGRLVVASSQEVARFEPNAEARAVLIDRVTALRPWSLL